MRVTEEVRSWVRAANTHGAMAVTTAHESDAQGLETQLACAIRCLGNAYGELVGMKPHDHDGMRLGDYLEVVVADEARKASVHRESSHAPDRIDLVQHVKDVLGVRS